MSCRIASKLRGAVLQNDPGWDSRADLQLGDFSVLNFVEQRHQPDDFGAKQEVGLSSFRTGTFLGIELDVHQHDALRVRENGFVIPNEKIADFSVIR
jgi:hypothetical protein